MRIIYRNADYKLVTMSPDRDLCSLLVRPRAEDVQVEYLTIVLYFVSIPILFAELMPPDSPLRI